MFVEILIYIYLGICAGMILFNIVTALLSRRRTHRFHRRSIRFEKEISRELDRLRKPARFARSTCAAWNASCAG